MGKQSQAEFAASVTSASSLRGAIFAPAAAGLGPHPAHGAECACCAAPGAATGEAAFVHAENLGFVYSGAEGWVLRGLNLHVRRGAYVSILGENGCGKSTLVKLLLGLLEPSEGRCGTLAARRAYVAQRSDFMNSRFPLTVLEMLDSYRRLVGVKDKRAARAVLEAVRLEDKAGALVGELSGGQTQRAFIARALLGDPELLVLDEPGSGVDAASRADIYGFLGALNKDRGLTIISIEHDLEAALSRSSLIYHVAGGRGHACDPDSYAAEYLKTGKGRAFDA